MRIIIFILTNMWATILFAAQAPTAPIKNTNNTLPLVPGATFNFNVVVQNKQDTQSNNSTNVATAQIAKQTEDSPILKKIAELRPDLSIPQSIKDQLNGKNNFFDSYKWQMIGGALLTTYAALCSIVISGNSYLGSNDLWSSWHQELPLEQLLAIPQQQFAQELIHEIQRRYTDPAFLTDLVKPLTQFIKVIDQEEEQIRWYHNAYSWLSYLYLDHTIPFSKHRFISTTQRLQRITYFKNVFQSWAAQYQLQHAARCIMDMFNNCPKNVTDIAALMMAVHKAKMRMQFDI